EVVALLAGAHRAAWCGDGTEREYDVVGLDRLTVGPGQPGTQLVGDVHALANLPDASVLDCWHRLCQVAERVKVWSAGEKAVEDGLLNRGCRRLAAEVGREPARKLPAADADRAARPGCSLGLVGTRWRDGRQTSKWQLMCRGSARQLGLR